MPETELHERITRLEGDVKEVKNSLTEHVRRFGEVHAAINAMQSSVDVMIRAREREAGAAEAIADLAEKRSRQLSEENAVRSRTLTIIGLVAAAVYTFVNVAIQKHWF